MRPWTLPMVVVIAASMAACSPSRVVVTIENADTDTLKSVSIATGEYTRFLGNLAPGQVARDTLIPSGEGSIYLEHGNPRKRLAVVSYFQAGDLDSVRAQVLKDTVKAVRRW